MAQIAFDTLEYSNRLQAGGIPREQAEAIARANANALKDMLTAQELVTKKDLAIALAETRSALEAKLAITRSDLEAKLADTSSALEAKLADTRSALEAKLADTSSALEAKLADTRSSLEAKLADTKHELLKWIVGLAAAQVTLMTAIAGIVIAVLK